MPRRLPTATGDKANQGKKRTSPFTRSNVSSCTAQCSTAWPTPTPYKKHMHACTHRGHKNKRLVRHATPPHLPSSKQANLTHENTQSGVSLAPRRSPLSNSERTRGRTRVHPGPCGPPTRFAVLCGERKKERSRGRKNPPSKEPRTNWVCAASAGPDEVKGVCIGR